MSSKRQLWQLHLTAKTYGQRPSDLVGVSDRWAALQFDNAAALVGIVIENASQEMTNVGSEKQPKWEPKYSMSQLLDPEFRLPQPTRKEQAQGIQGLMSLPGVKKWKV